MHDAFLVVGGGYRAAEEPVLLGRVPDGGLRITIRWML